MKRVWPDKHKRLCINYPCELHGYGTIEFDIAVYLFEKQSINLNLDE